MGKIETWKRTIGCKVCTKWVHNGKVERSHSEVSYNKKKRAEPEVFGMINYAIQL